MTKPLKNINNINSDTSEYWHSYAVILDRKGKVKFITEALANLLGFTISDLLGKDAIKLLIDKSEQDEKRAQLDFLYEQESVINAFDVQLNSKAKNPVNLRFNILNLISDDSRDIAFIGDNLATTQKVTKRIDNPEWQLSQLVAAVREFLIIIDNNEIITSINLIGEEKLGIKAGMTLRELLEPTAVKSTRAFLNSLGNINSAANINLVLIHPRSKQKFYLAGSVSSIVVDDAIKQFRLILNDVTEQIKTEKAKGLYYSIAHHSIHSKNLDELYYYIHKELKQVVDCDNLYIALVDREDDEFVLSFPYYQEDNLSRIIASDRKYGLGLTEYIISQKKPQLLTKEVILDLAKEGTIELYGRTPEIWLGVPLKAKSEVIGVIAVQSFDNATQYTSRDLKLLDFASSQIAMAIDMVRTQEKLKTQTAKLNSIIESSSHLIWTVNSELELTSFNKNYFDAIINNYDVMPEIIEGSSTMIQSFDGFWKEKYQQCFEGKPLNFEIMLRDSAGNDVWKEIHLNPIYLDGGIIEEISGIANDITQKKISEKALIESEEKFRNIFESFQDVYLRVDRNGIINMVSPSVKTLVGLEVRDILDKSVGGFYKAEHSSLALLKELITARHLKNIEISVRHFPNELVECICNLSLVTNEAGRTVYIEAVIRDVTKLKITNKELIEAKNLAERSLMVKDQFLANMSHEIRTPLNGIIGVIDLLEQTKLAKEQGSYLKTIKSSSETLLNILNDILDLSKIEAGKMELRPAPLSINNLVAKLKSLFAPRASTQLINLDFHIGKNIPMVIEADQMRLIQIISNLIANAIKFTNRGGSIDIGFKLQSEQDNDLVIKVDVRDSGIGIKKEDIEQLFTSFNQLDNSTTKAYSGTGLGLSISKQLVELMGGEIAVHSNPGLGSTFWFNFKTRRSLEKVAPETTPSSSKEIIRKFTDLIPYILVVDDNLVNRDVAGEILKKCGCKVDLASNGIEAVFKASTKNYDIIFMDIQMPEMDGIEANRQIKNLDKEKKPWVIAMTAYSLKEDEERFIHAGLDDYLAKPIRARELISKVQSRMGGTKIVSAPPEQQEGDLQIINAKTLNQLQKYGGEEMVYNAIKEFEEEAEGQLEGCFKALAKEDFETIKSILHTLKGSAGTLGIEKVAHIATLIEGQVKKQDYSKLEKRLLELRHIFIEFKENFTNIISKY